MIARSLVEMVGATFLQDTNVIYFAEDEYFPSPLADLAYERLSKDIKTAIRDRNARVSGEMDLLRDTVAHNLDTSETCTGNIGPG
jgi:hypothetical protein